MKQDKILYLPVSSQNFNAIFASESLSPPRFYAKRNFGHNRFDMLFKYSDSGIILFEDMPYFDIDDNSDIETYLLIFEFSALEGRYLTEIGQGVWRYDSTIYLNQNNFRLHFLDPYVKKVMLAEAKTSKTTKTVAKFELNFSDNKIPKSNLKRYQLPIAKIEETDIERKVAIDRLFNSFKGFIYGFIAGEVGKKSSIEIEFAKSVQNIINCFAQYKNELADSSSAPKYQSSKSYQKQTPTFSKNRSVEFELNEALKNGKQLFSHLFGKDKLEPSKWVTDYLKLPSEDESIVKKVLSLMSRWFFDFDSTIKREYAKNTNSPMFLFEIVEDNIRQYKSAGVEQRQRLDEEIKDNLFSIEKYIKTKSLERAGNKEVSDFEQIELLVKEEEIKLAKTKLNEKDTDNFVKICNVLLKERKDFTGKTNDEDLLIVVEKVWDSFGSSNSRTSNPIHKYLSHKSKTIEIEKKTDVVENFIAFLLNPNSIEQLKTYVEDKKIQNSWISFSFWGLYNGFANIGRDFTNVILGTDNFDLMRGIDNYLDKILQKIEADYEYKKPMFANAKQESRKSEQMPNLEGKKGQITEGVSSAVTIEFDLTTESLVKVLKSLESDKAKKVQKMVEKLNTEYNKFGHDYRVGLLKKEIEKSNKRVKKTTNKITITEIDRIVNAYKASNTK